MSRFGVERMPSDWRYPYTPSDSPRDSDKVKEWQHGGLRLYEERKIPWRLVTGVAVFVSIVLAIMLSC